MALLVWFTVALALWHFTIFFRARPFLAGIVGAFLGCCVGSVSSGPIVET